MTAHELRVGFVIEGITGVVSRGDGWNTDDDIDIFHENIRPATQEEINAHTCTKHRITQPEGTIHE